MISEPWDVVVVPFPFTERPTTKRRPALVLSHTAFNEAGYTLLAMITTQAHTPWPGDTTLQDRDAAGLRVPCIVRPPLSRRPRACSRPSPPILRLRYTNGRFSFSPSGPAYQRLYTAHPLTINVSLYLSR